jgi:REP element-mobilizing transposase RayT
MRPLPHAEPLAYFLTWTTYGSWLPGDERGWVDRRGAVRGGNPLLRSVASHRLTSACVSLTSHQRGLVVRCVTAHARFRGWTLHAVQCRTQHVHVVIGASGRSTREVIAELKAQATRMLDAAEGERLFRRLRRWWTRGGSGRQVFDERSLENVVMYVRECQDRRREG